MLRKRKLPLLLNLFIRLTVNSSARLSLRNRMLHSPGKIFLKFASMHLQPRGMKHSRILFFPATSKVNFLQLEKNLPKGKYYWRVSGMLEGNDSTAPSLVRYFSIIDIEELKLVIPQNNAILSVEENDKSALRTFFLDSKRD